MIVRIDGGYFWSKTLRAVYLNCHNIEIGYGTYGGAFDLKKIPLGTKFGRYCLIAKNVYVLNANHPKFYFSLHPLFHNPELGYVKHTQIERNKLTVGNDVWVGVNSIILPSVNYIGDGAIIGAGSIVTSDVEPYTIVAGNPATVKSKRFSPETIKKLQDSKWWELGKDELIKRKGEFERYVNFCINVAEL